MSGDYFLVDYENVGPSLRHCQIADDAQVLVFLGQSTAKISPRLASWLGRRGEYISIDGRGPNALDFHISYYAGAIVNADRTSKITIISGDKGFDPLLAHMNRAGVWAKRIEPPTRKTTAALSERAH